MAQRGVSHSPRSRTMTMVWLAVPVPMLHGVLEEFAMA